MNPINGTPTIAVHRPTSAMESFSKNRRRLISSGVSVSGADDDSVSFVSMANLRDPTGKRCDEEDNTNQPTQIVINPQKRKATPIANPAGKYVGWGKGVSGSICQPGGTASECCVVGCSLGI